MKQVLMFLALCLVVPVFAMEEVIVKKATASETLPSQGKNNYSVSNLLDNDYKSVWAAPFKSKPLTLEFYMEAFELGCLYIENGYWRDQESIENNSRAKRVNIYVNSKSSLVMTVDLEDPAKDSIVSKAAKFGNNVYHGQVVYFPQVQTNVKKVILEVESIYEGKKWKDLCISSIAFLGNKKNPVVTKGIIGTFKDPRDEHVYKTTTIGNTTWLAENLAYDYYDYNDKIKIDDRTGVLYKREFAKNACPAGWSLPTQKEWKELVKTAGAVEWLTSETVDFDHRDLRCIFEADSAGLGCLDPYTVDRLNFGLKFSRESLYDGECGEEFGAGYGGGAYFWTSDYVEKEDEHNFGGEGTGKIRYDYVVFGKYFMDPQDSYCSKQTWTEFANIRCVKDR